MADAFPTTRAWGEVCSRVTQRVQRDCLRRGVLSRCIGFGWVGDATTTNALN